MIEHWAVVLGYEHLYEVSSMGRVRGLKRNKLLKCWPDSNGRMQVTLCKDGKLKRHQVHALMLCAFVSPKPFENAVCRHLNGDHTINELWNLAWGTQSENMNDRVIHGRAKLGEEHQFAKIDAELVRAIRQAWENKEGSQHRLAQRFGVSQPHLHLIVRRKIWKHVW